MLQLSTCLDLLVAPHYIACVTFDLCCTLLDGRAVAGRQRRGGASHQVPEGGRHQRLPHTQTEVGLTVGLY